MGQPACLRDHGEAVGWSGVDKEEATEGRDRKLVRRDFNSWARTPGLACVQQTLVEERWQGREG